MPTTDGAIVVGIDGSPESDGAVRWAVAEAHAQGVGLHVLHALPLPIGELPPTPEEVRALREEGDRLLADAAGRASAAGVPVVTETVTRSPAPALIEASRRARTVVVGARGHSAVVGFLLGSVSRHLAAHGHCPVVVTRGPARPQDSRVVVGVDGSPGADAAIGFAMQHAARAGAVLVALYGWRDREVAAFGRGEPDWVRTRARIQAGTALLDRALTTWREKFPQVDVLAEAIPEHPVRALVDASEHAGLVVVGGRGHGGFAGLPVGSVSQAVLTHAHCPVAVVR
jgi:nucleotide-binding universal stress UspA family protein